MKVIKIANTIVALDKVKSVQLCISGSGAKSNPFNYAIDIAYFGNEREYLNIGDDEKLAKESMEKIFNILENNT